ncbi:hypothetical protein ACFVOR_37240 [Streptomyces sp. NPDC057837]|uniref:hypothetical protein n=1 Tax=Streptomyces sp. NPDC057837 TaxID=3346260 RepID=UPI0036960B38
MSSSYYILCLSHDPATTAREARSAEDAADVIRAGVDGHRDCDLLIERVSGGPVEYGCPPQGTRAAGPPCRHRDVEWADVDWLRLLGRAHTSADAGVRDAVRKGRFFCWTPDRLHRLRQPLRNEDDVHAAVL